MKAFLAWYGRSRKAIATEVGALITWFGTAYVPTGHVSAVGWYTLAIAVAAGLGVYAVPNDPPSAPASAKDGK